ncbi:hypothetical protein [Actinoallomurus sp. CA-150999]|uniref:hypothetical protein n=1 Tax=Actinoallomurus sp. CA-150999 TaxID=3239887 RepID=UPI003D8D12C8
MPDVLATERARRRTPPTDQAPTNFNDFCPGNHGMAGHRVRPTSPVCSSGGFSPPPPGGLDGRRLEDDHPDEG